MYQDLFKKIGLSEVETKIYLAAMELGQSLPKHLALKAKIKRPTLYQLLPGLFEKGLLFETIKGKRRYLVAEDPQIFLENKKTVLDQIEKSIPYLHSIISTASSKPKINFYEGIDGLKKVLMDNLNVRVPIFEYVGLEKIHPDMVVYYDKYYIPERIRRRISIKIIVSGMQKKAPFNLVSKEDEFREVRSILKKDFLIPLDIYIYGDNVSFLVFRKDSEPLGMIIRSKEIAVSMKSIFNFMWMSFE